MTYVSGIDASRASNSATYNAVKIQINDPQTNIREGYKTQNGDNGTYNAVSIEVNRPTVEAGNHPKHKSIYEYPQAKAPITSDMLATLPIASHTTNYINNRTLINADIDIDSKAGKKGTSAARSNVFPQSVVLKEEIIAVPVPNISELNSKSEVAEKMNSNGLTFRANEPKHEIEIVPAVDIKPEINISEVLQNLSDPDFDIKAKQMADIADAAFNTPSAAIPYITSEVFSELIKILEINSLTLVPPTEKQIETRKQIIINELVKEEAMKNNKPINNSELPYQLTPQEIQEAIKLSPMEQAERNKDYALYTMAALAKIYVEEVEKHTGNIIPLTDLPGASEIVNALRANSNSSVKTAAIEALVYINRPEYRDEIKSILQIATKDQNPYVAEVATDALNRISL